MQLPRLFTDTERRARRTSTLGDPMLRGTTRDHVMQQRRPFARFFACELDLSHEPPDAPLPDAVASRAEPFFVVGAIAGG
jgi:sulfur-carrier protein